MSLETDREKHPLMRDLHELALKHGVCMAVVAIDMGEAVRPPVCLAIDGEEASDAATVAELFELSGSLLIKASDRILRGR